MALGKNIKAHRQARGWEQKTLSSLSGVEIGTISALEVRDSKRSDKAPALARAFGISTDELITGLPIAAIGTDSMDVAHMRAQPKPIEMENNPDYPAVRRVSVKAQAGIAGFAIEDVQDTAPIVFRADWYKGKGYRPERMMALRVAGESMLPGLGPDDLVVVNTESAAPKDGCAFLVAYYGEVVVKRLIFDEGMWWLCSDNPDQRRYPRKRCDDGTQIIGEVVYKQSERV
jgi:phage repressor protein C with HTH and peptisase S24 domain